MSHPDEPLVTTVIPTYKRPALLERAVRSALAQTCTRVRVLVCDNASGDETAAVVARIAQDDARVVYHCHPENVGPFKNFEWGMKHVETPYFSFLPDDDILLPDFYQHALQAMEAHPEAAFVGAPTIVMNERGVASKIIALGWPREGVFQSPEGLLELAGGDAPGWMSTLFRREITEYVEMDDQVGSAVDLDIMLRAASRAPFVMTRKPGAIFFVHGGSASDKLLVRYFWPGWRNLVEKTVGDLALPAAVRNEVGRRLTAQIRGILWGIGAQSLKEGDRQEAARAAQVLRRELGDQKHAMMLTVAGWLHRYCPPLYRVLEALHRLYTRVCRSRAVRRRDDIAEQYAAYSRFLRTGGGA